jgi:hypothetical protein
LAAHGGFQRCEVTADISGHALPLRSRVDHESPPVGNAGLAGDQAAFDQAIENAGQR